MLIPVRPVARHRLADRLPEVAPERARGTTVARLGPVLDPAQRSPYAGQAHAQVQALVAADDRVAGGRLLAVELHGQAGRHLAQLHLLAVNLDLASRASQLPDRLHAVAYGAEVTHRKQCVMVGRLRQAVEQRQQVRMQVRVVAFDLGQVIGRSLVAGAQAVLRQDRPGRGCQVAVSVAVVGLPQALEELQGLFDLTLGGAGLGHQALLQRLGALVLYSTDRVTGGHRRGGGAGRTIGRRLEAVRTHVADLTAGDRLLGVAPGLAGGQRARAGLVGQGLGLRGGEVHPGIVGRGLLGGALGGHGKNGVGLWLPLAAHGLPCRCLRAATSKRVSIDFSVWMVAAFSAEARVRPMSPL